MGFTLHEKSSPLRLPNAICKWLGYAEVRFDTELGYMCGKGGDRFVPNK